MRSPWRPVEYASSRRREQYALSAVSIPVRRTTMRATEALMQEHRVIERVLDALEIAASHLERERPVRPGFFLEAADFIAGFADGCHHRKEEGVLFGACLLYTSP